MCFDGAKIAILKDLSDNKRQQTFTVDYKHLINASVLTGFASLQQNNDVYDFESLSHSTVNLITGRISTIPKPKRNNEK